MSGDAAQGAGEGFAFGASQEDVDAVLADLEPVTLSYQPGGSSAESVTAANGLAFKEYVEERSGGKITLETTWGQAIAPYDELVDALNDGRVDIAYHAAIYFPDEFPTVDAFSKLTQYSTPAPLTGEAISAAMMSELAWNSDEHLQSIEDQGLVPLSPLMSSGDYWTACGAEGTLADDWKGRQIRIAGTAHTALAETIGASPVSMEYGETYEALQRNTVDCTFVQPQVAGSTGLLEVAPHVSHFSDQRMTGGATAMHVAGSGFQQLPLAYQQIIFDAEADHMHGVVQATLDAGHQSVLDSSAAGGEFSVMDAEVEDMLVAKQEELVDDLIADGQLPEDIRDQMHGLADKWTGIVEELGYTDDGELSELDEWYEPGSIDFRPLGERLFTEAAEQHRPGTATEDDQ
ncbi:C4-dicarboxylate ABC transporter substrate-binding protein [Brevibacterium yomogidense]|uniref:TRAP-type C4-dicarboxylate transport system, periplasmic component n=1 Tax=Brevibacterium yomogidense TaxID=946573 RepID=A0A1X6WWR9_9MICO|nr:C4-dicarboxylate ABC transporter substrate-binding protein [Brevibacterium yomogidense]SLM90126.1 TRAP-type C4-dicarboxylate transport system, periplasmic component [Brevibacterium yomogidense]